MSVRLRKGAGIALAGVLGMGVGYAPAARAQGRAQATPASPPGPAAQTPAAQTPAAQPTPAGTTPGPADTAESPWQQRLDAVLGRPGGLTADQVARRAADTSADVRARQQEIIQAQAAVDQVVAQAFPRLSLSARYARESPIEQPSFGNLVAAPSQPAGPIPAGTQLVNVPFTIPVILDQYALSAQLNLPLSDYLLRVAQGYAAASHSRRAAEFNVRATRLRAAFDARVLYYNWVRALLQTAVAEQALGQAREHLTDVQHAFNAGAASQADVMRVQSQLANVELLLARAQNAAALMAGQIATVTHADALPGEVGEDVRADEAAGAMGAGGAGAGAGAGATGTGTGTGTVGAGGVPGDFPAMYDEALVHRLELQALSETLGSLRDQARVARAGLYPRLDAFGSVLAANPNPRFFPPQQVWNTTWEVGVALSWSPNDLGVALAQSTAADARAQQVEEQRNALRDALRTEVLQASLSVREAEAAVRATAEGLAASEESYRVRRSLFRNGRATSVELTDAETDLTRARVEALNARVDLRLARARLAHALGRDVSDAP